jgi:hypothetical protein
LLQIVIPTRSYGSPPARALLIEGYEVLEVQMSDPQHYGRLIRHMWDIGNGFVLVEDDVVPWPGAVQQLLDCEHDWCAFRHPRTNANPGSLCLGFGCVRFSHALVRRHRVDTLDGSQRWDEVDGAVIGVLDTAGETCHEHSPPVAHLKAHGMLHRRADIPS